MADRLLQAKRHALSAVGRAQARRRAAAFGPEELAERLCYPQTWPMVARLVFPTPKHSDSCAAWYPSLQPQHCDCGATASNSGRERRRLKRTIQWLCAKTGGHELSRTELGYGGGEMVDRWCRWCNYRIPIPVDESPNAQWLVDFFHGLNRGRRHGG